jgi:hypothetical protein
VLIGEIIVEEQQYKTNRWVAGIAALVAFLAIGFIVRMSVAKGLPYVPLGKWILELIPQLVSQWKSGDHAPNGFITISIILVLWILVAVAFGWAVGKLQASISQKN